MRKKVFITGASGFLGQAIIADLAKSHDLYILQHNKKFKIPKWGNVTIINGSVDDISELENYSKSLDVVIHFAGVTHTDDPDLYLKVNTHGTRNLLNYAKKYKVKQFIYISTRALGKNCGVYGDSKKRAEEFVKKSNLTYTIMRVAEVYNDDFKTNEGLGSIYNLIKQNYILPCPGDKNITLSPIHVNDVASCIIAAVNNSLAKNKTYVLAGPENLSIKEVFIRIADLLGKKRIFIPIPTKFLVVIFFLAHRIVGVGAPDQLNRLLCKKETLSSNVARDLKIRPKKFLE